MGRVGRTIRSRMNARAVAVIMQDALTPLNATPGPSIVQSSGLGRQPRSLEPFQR